jgi:NTP pyrophosphatase (non-canonical NTP hydrolase)
MAVSHSTILPYREYDPIDIIHYMNMDSGVRHDPTILPKLKAMTLTLNQYQELALRTAPQGVSLSHDRTHAAWGLVDEVGEIAKALKKEHAYGKVVDVTNLIEEIGDCQWFIALMCRALGVSLEEVAKRNIAKLSARYPERFTQERALNRDLLTERAILETPIL